MFFLHCRVAYQVALGKGQAPHFLLSLCLLLILYPFNCRAFSPALDHQALADLSMEELANLDITSVTKQVGALSAAPASLYVISASDIRRSGATSLPQALRLAPNLMVSQISASNYAINARGFNTSTSNKMQVLIDGRILYTPLFSGVFWDAQDLLMEDIERIEVISGPAAAIWGANAVNGVINIITRSAATTQGNMLSLQQGDQQQALAVRHGGQMGQDGHYRLYAKFSDQDGSVSADGSRLADDWHKTQLGFRMDFGQLAPGLSLQGDAYKASLGDPPDPEPTRIEGANLLLHYSKDLSSSGSVAVKAYYDYAKRDIPGRLLEELDTSHVELIHNLLPMGKHSLQWGIDHRFARDRVDNSQALAFLPAHKSLRWSSVFVQDQIALSEQWQVILNARVEHNDYTGTEVMPALRLAWQPGEQQLVWAALSRAVRTPSRIDREFHVPGIAPHVLSGGADFRAETADVIEAGYRALYGESLSWSVTLFHARYDHLRTVEPTDAGTLVIANKMEADSQGMELWGNYQIMPNWRISAGFVAQQLDFELKPDSLDPNQGTAEGNDPQQHWRFRSQWTLLDSLQLDLLLRHVDSLPQPQVPAYTAVDINLSWQFKQQLSLSLNGQNLFDSQHSEFGRAADRSEMERRVYVGVKWHF